MYFHICLDIQGGIEHANNLRVCIRENGKFLKTVREVREFLSAQLALGKKYIPCGNCNHFDDQKGCLGHKTIEETQT